MKIAYWSTILLIILFSKSSASFAQINTNETWKKQVGREIDMKVPEDEKKHHLKEVSYDTTLLEILCNAVYAGRITPWANDDPYFSHKMTIEELNKLLIPTPDTVIITDPSTDQEIRKIVRHDFDYERVSKYRLLEDWTFNPATGNTDIHIEGIAPVIEIYVDGELRGERALFWMRYSDVIPVLQHYEQSHPLNTFAQHIWNDYFYSDVKPAVIK